MFTIKNYFDQINKLDLSSLPEAIKKGHDFVVKATSNGESWSSYQSSEAIKNTIALYFTKLNEVAKKEAKVDANISKKLSHKNNRANSRNPAQKIKPQKPSKASFRLCSIFSGGRLNFIFMCDFSLSPMKK